MHQTFILFFSITQVRLCSLKQQKYLWLLINKQAKKQDRIINCLLQARIAKEENLPIYVVCTMRSDYIGQCAAFRGLPEFIGYSQFFVPRLNRKQLQEVIAMFFAQKVHVLGGKVRAFNIQRKYLCIVRSDLGMTNKGFVSMNTNNCL